MNPRSRSVLAALGVLALVVVTACTGGDGDADDTAEPAATEAARGSAPPTDAGSADATSGDESTSVAATDPTATTDPTITTDPTTTIGTVPDEGVPGIDSADAFCRAWSEFAGSFQALALAYGFGADPGEPPRLEVAASPVLVAAVDGLGEHLPAELESERAALTSDLAGPMLRRAERAVAELRAAGVSDEAIAELGDEWLETVSSAGLDDPDITVTVNDAPRFAGFESAAEAFAADVPPINQDPSLITDAQVPLTEGYLAQNCPDQGTLAGNDVIDQI